jgi:hypothetical protein
MRSVLLSELGQFQSLDKTQLITAKTVPTDQLQRNYRVFHFEVSISAPRLDLGSKPQQILTLARARSIWNFQPLGAKARAMLVDFSDALSVKPV